MRLLVTRPEPDANETAAALAALGHSVLVEPLTRIVFLAPPVIAFRPAAIVFTSRNGVRAAAAWPQVSDWREVTAFAVGDKTGQAARDAGFTDVRIGGGDAASLAEAIVRALDPAAGTILRVAGRDRAGDLEGGLGSQGFATVTVEAYVAVAAADLSAGARQALATGALDGALVFSRRAASIFGDLLREAGLGEALHAVTVYAISESAAEPLRPYHPAGMRIASNPDAESLIASIPR
jgi:uroporphyrinogen-III synthase